MIHSCLLFWIWRRWFDQGQNAKQPDDRQDSYQVGKDLNEQDHDSKDHECDPNSFDENHEMKMGRERSVPRPVIDDEQEFRAEPSGASARWPGPIQFLFPFLFVPVRLP